MANSAYLVMFINIPLFLKNKLNGVNVLWSVFKSGYHCIASISLIVKAMHTRAVTFYLKFEQPFECGSLKKSDPAEGALSIDSALPIAALLTYH